MTCLEPDCLLTLLSCCAAAQGAVRSGYAGLAAGCLHSLAGVDHLAVWMLC